MYTVIGILIGTIVGAILSFLIQSFLLKKRVEKTLLDAEHDGEAIKKDKIFQAKERFLKLKEEHEEVIKDRERKTQSNEDKIKAKEKALSQKTEEVARKEKELDKTQLDLDHKIATVEVKHQELDKTQQKRVAELSRISGMSVEDAKNHMMEALVDEARTGAMALIKELKSENFIEINGSQDNSVDFIKQSILSFYNQYLFKNNSRAGSFIDFLSSY